MPMKLGSVSASVETVRGVINVSWLKENGNGYIEISLPGNTEAIVRLPANTELALVPAKSPGFLMKHRQARTRDYTTYHVGAGQWRFSLNSLPAEKHPFESKGKGI